MMLVAVGGAHVGKHIPKGSVIEDIAWEKLERDELLALATTAPLFSGTRTLRLEGALGGAQGEEFLALAGELARSPHTFIFIEEKLLKKPTDALTKAGATVLAAPAAKKAEAFNIFALANAFGARDRKKLWILLVEAGRAGAAPEAVAGMLHWKVRDMLGKGARSAYTPEELKRLSRELVVLYHDSHRGAGELGLLLERFALNL